MGIAAAPQKLKTVGPTTLPLLVAYELQHPQSYKWLNTFCASPLLRLRCCMSSNAHKHQNFGILHSWAFRA
jgi:hypothetical protein